MVIKVTPFEAVWPEADPFAAPLDLLVPEEVLTQAGLTRLQAGVVHRLVDTAVSVRTAQMRQRLEQQLADLEALIVRMSPDAESAAVATRGDVVIAEDPMEGLSAAELAARLGLSDESVRNREKAGALFAVLRPARKRGREYPAFQAWDAVAGAPLARVLGALGEQRTRAAYGFFASANDLIGGLTPVELLTGHTLAASVHDEAAALLERPAAERVALAETCARTYAGTFDA